jgi:hypothetical protein
MVSSNFYKLLPLPAVKGTQLMAIILIILFSATIIHIQSNQQANSMAIPDEASASIAVSNLSYGEKDICTYNCTPSYYNITQEHYSQTEYSFNLSWNINREVEASTENNIILVQGNKTLISIEYGKFNSYDTIVSGSKNYTNILSFHNCGTWYNLSIILSDHMKNHAIIMQGDGHDSIPYIIALKNPYTDGNVTFMFGGKYSNQTIGRISVRNYTQLISPDGATTSNMGLESSTLIPYPLYNSSMAFMDSKLNSVIYLDSDMSIIRYNYYNGNYSVLEKISDASYSDINSFQYGGNFIFYYSTSDNAHIFNVNSTDLSVNRTVIPDDDSTHLLLYENQYIMFNLNGTFIFPGNYNVNIPGVKILSINASKNIQITAFSGNTVYNYTMNNTMVPVHTGSYSWNMSGNVIYSRSINGIDYYLEYGPLKLKPYGHTYYNLSNPLNDVYENNGGIYELNNGKFLNTGINANNSQISEFHGGIISMKGLHMSVYSYNDILSPYTIKINNVTESVNYRNTTLKFNISSGLGYNLSLTLFNRTYYVNNNEISFISNNTTSGIYNYSAIAINTAGYKYTGNYKMEYNNTLYVEPVPVLKPVTTITSASIDEKAGQFYIKINGNNTGNVTVVWFINGVYAGSGPVLNKGLPEGIDKISAEIRYDGKIYTVKRTFVALGNIPYLVGAAGIASIITIFSVETFYFNNREFDEIIENSYGKTLKELIKTGRKKRASGRKIKYRLKVLSMEGKISIVRDLDNKKYVMANKRNKK